MYWYLRVSESKYYALTSNSSYFIGVIFLHAKHMLTFGFFHELGALILLLILCTLNFLWLDCSYVLGYSCLQLYYLYQV